jgi:acyl-CoA thioester hydrolase
VKPGRTRDGCWELDARDTEPAGEPVTSEYPVLHRLATRWHDNDSYGHVNNATYYEYFDTVVNSFLHTEVGETSRLGSVIGVVAESSCTYLSELSFPDELVVGLACERLGHTSISYRLAIWRYQADREPSSRPSATGRFVHVYIDRDTRRPSPIPDPIRDAITRVLLASNGESV